MFFFKKEEERKKKNYRNEELRAVHNTRNEKYHGAQNIDSVLGNVSRRPANLLLKRQKKILKCFSFFSTSLL
jgi:hypothetical protein